MNHWMCSFRRNYLAYWAVPMKWDVTFNDGVQMVGCWSSGLPKCDLCLKYWLKNNYDNLWAFPIGIAYQVPFYSLECIPYLLHSGSNFNEKRITFSKFVWLITHAMNLDDFRKLCEWRNSLTEKQKSWNDSWCECDSKIENSVNCQFAER